MKGYRNTETGQVVEIPYSLSRYRTDPAWEEIGDDEPLKPVKKAAKKAAKKRAAKKG